jgi:hypothetical protein
MKRPPFYIFDANGEYWGTRKTKLGCLRALAQAFDINKSHIIVEEARDGAVEVSVPWDGVVYFDLLPQGHPDVVIRRKSYSS